MLYLDQRDTYINSVLDKYKTNGLTVFLSPTVAYIINPIKAIVSTWAGGQLKAIELSGSFAKGTATALSTDADLFISLKSDTTQSLKDIYKMLYNRMKANGYSVREQNVSIGVTVNNFKVDLVPAVHRGGLTRDHSLYRRKADTWTQTNIYKHIDLVKNSKRLDEIRALKIWRTLNGLDFPSFYLELTVIEALKGHGFNKPGQNLLTVLDYIANKFTYARVVDPSNTNNIISDELTAGEKQTIANLAKNTRQKQYMKDIIW
ncbi:nucleotidyltransferase domain-containing protein [bacterium]|nr:MAG: nucleotidyltransferase domain-containing protein [bacterium]